MDISGYLYGQDNIKSIEYLYVQGVDISGYLYVWGMDISVYLYV